LGKVRRTDLRRAREPGIRLVDLEATSPLTQHESTLVICDSEPVFAKGLAKLLQSEAHEFRVVEVVTSKARLEDAVRQRQPDLAVLDVRFGLESARSVRAASPQTKIAILTRGEDETDLSWALQAGVRGYLLRDHEVTEMVKVLRLVLEDYLVVPTSIASRHPGGAARSLSDLDDTERDILAGIAQGETNREIATRLHVSERTIRRRVLQIYSKLGVADRLEAMLYAFRSGLLGSD
jgi:DNA-binding NarL/FixJ family response regulator